MALNTGWERLNATVLMLLVGWLFLCAYLVATDYSPSWSELQKYSERAKNFEDASSVWPNDCILTDYRKKNSGDVYRGIRIEPKNSFDELAFAGKYSLRTDLSWEGCEKLLEEPWPTQFFSPGSGRSKTLVFGLLPAVVYLTGLWWFGFLFPPQSKRNLRDGLRRVQLTVLVSLSAFSIYGLWPDFQHIQNEKAYVEELARYDSQKVSWPQECLVESGTERLSFSERQYLKNNPFDRMRMPVLAEEAFVKAWPGCKSALGKPRHPYGAFFDPEQLLFLVPLVVYLVITWVAKGFLSQRHT